jgi:transketolase
MGEPLMMREAFGRVLVDLGRRHPDVVVLDADLANSTKACYFRDQFPDRFFQLGVAEQNMVAVAAGLAYEGLIPFVVTYASFLCKRGLDQIRILIAQPKANVKLIGCYSGLSSGLNGKSHQTVQDIAIMRSMPDMKVVEPLDVVEMASVLKVITTEPGPFYVRLVRGPTAVVFSENEKLSCCKGVFLREGSDIALISTGTQTVSVLEAADILKAQGIDAEVLHLSWIKPIDEKAIVRAARRAGVVVTIEEHNIIGGLGSAVAEVLSEYYPVPLKRLGIGDSFGQTGSVNDLMEKYELTPVQIASKASAFLKKNRKK